MLPMIKHGQCKTRTYKSWCSMKERCENPRHERFSDYGKRGIKICERWQDFENFLADMGERPQGMSLGRIDNDGNYCKENCRWETRLEQQNNTRFNLLVSINGTTKTASQWASILGMDSTAMRMRIYRGWPIKKLLKQPRKSPTKTKG